MIEETSLIEGNRVKVRGTEDYGSIIEVRAARTTGYNNHLYISVMLENGNILVYGPSELKVL